MTSRDVIRACRFSSPRLPGGPSCLCTAQSAPARRKVSDPRPDLRGGFAAEPLHLAPLHLPVRGSSPGLARQLGRRPSVGLRGAERHVVESMTHPALLKRSPQFSPIANIVTPSRSFRAWSGRPASCGSPLHPAPGSPTVRLASSPLLRFGEGARTFPHGSKGAFAEAHSIEAHRSARQNK